MVGNLVIDGFLSFSGGFLAFFSPCILLVLLGFFAFSFGLSLASTENGKIEHHSVLPSLMMIIIGLSTVFVINFFPSEIQRLHMKYYNPSAKVAGVIIFLFGLYFLEFLKIRLIPKGQQITKFNLLILSSYLVLGLSFGIAWTHCMTPILQKVIQPIIQNPSLLVRGFFLLWLYALGLSIPLIGSGLIINKLCLNWQFIKDNAQELKVINGLILVVMGIALFNKPWWIYLSGTLIDASHDSWKNQLETWLIALLK